MVQGRTSISTPSVMFEGHAVPFWDGSCKIKRSRISTPVERHISLQTDHSCHLLTMQFLGQGTSHGFTSVGLSCCGQNEIPVLPNFCVCVTQWTVRFLTPLNIPQIPLTSGSHVPQGSAFHMKFISFSQNVRLLHFRLSTSLSLAGQGAPLALGYPRILL